MPDMKLRFPGYSLAMQRFIDASQTERLGIYLNDHRGLFAAEYDLAKRCQEANVGTDHGSRLATLLTDVIGQNAADRERLDELLEVVGKRANPVKTLGARLGERLGRLKLNGQLRGYSPLSRVIEIEALIASTSVRQAMWTSLAVALTNDATVADANRRAQTVEGQHNLLLNHHLEAAKQAFVADPQQR